MIGEMRRLLAHGFGLPADGGQLVSSVGTSRMSGHGHGHGHGDDHDHPPLLCRTTSFGCRSGAPRAAGLGEASGVDCALAQPVLR